MRATSAAAALLLALAGSAPTLSAAHRTNPIRKVVTMLQDMQTKVAEEGKKEEDLYEKFMCYCTKNSVLLDQAIEDGKEKIESSGAEVVAKVEKKAQLNADLIEHNAGKAAAEEAVATASALREKESKEYAKVKADYKTNIASVKKAVAAIEQGADGSFLQTTAAGMLRSFAMERSEMSDATRQEVLAFLSGSQGSEYGPQSGEITGILKTMGDEMAQSLKEAAETETGATTNYEGLMVAKNKELSMLQQQIEDKMERVGTLGVEIAAVSGGLEDTTETLAQDQKFKAELDAGCSTKTAEWEEVKKTRAEELVAIGETIKVLNDDDALDLFKKTLPSASSSFMQIQVSASALKAQALQKIHAATNRLNRPELDLLALALHGKKVGFEKILVMIDEMVGNLKAEQTGDDGKKEYCESKLDESEDKKKELELSVSDSETAIGEMEGAIVSLTEEIAALKAGIVSLDKAVVEATEQRKEDNAEHKALMAGNQMAKEVLSWAKNRLNKFYNPKMYKAPPKLEEGDAPAGGGIADTGIGASFVQIQAHAQSKSRVAPPPPPETFGAYTTKGEESNGVLAMIDLLVADLDKETTEAEVMEKDAQTDYEKLMEDATTKRAADAKSLTQKEGAVADNEAGLEEAKAKKASTEKEAMGNAEYLASLHAECDWLLQYYETRKEARTNEVESLADAKAVLSGADFSLVQTSARRLTRHLRASKA